MMTHPIYKVRSFQKLAPYTLRVRFNDGMQHAINFFPILTGELYGPLRDLKLFNRVRLDPEVHTLVWPNGADFDPATLHDWPSCSQSCAAAARRWRPRRPKTKALRS